MLSDCLHSLTALGADGALALAGAMFLAGLAGGVTHCAGMCGPFVIAQTVQGLPSGRLARLTGLHLLPYQLGRAAGYVALGGAAGAAVGLASLGLSRSLLAVPLVLAALLMLVQAVPGLSLPWRLPTLPVPRLMRGLLSQGAPSPWRRFLLGLMLSALPCGLLYAALAAAAASGSALAGALAMLAFVAGTVPGLTGVSVLGSFFGRRFGARLRLFGALALLVNAALLLALALRVVAEA
ncbi:urease accessory protein UreH domain-containing protein [Roseococcus pinisoli]|uniref:Sulfite exporter TauE/SafE family protein n=1 Tax=Roseococcus pinisoli TaxID=2835040 RepID=A0ABS5QJ77_9PROT|nr:sulfite exporter TauE/SafE family protein [Roseococcus pinisoli]MBS7813734.1 sulfite exporter TauE/SafE family protein [Roseococcus pinisoli]